MSGNNCSIFNCHCSRAAPGISVFRTPTKNDKYSTNWRINVAEVVTNDRVIDGNLKR